MTVDEEITILIPSHNLRAYLDDCIASVKHQTRSNWRCIILDDASSDGTYQYLCNHPMIEGDSRFRVSRSPVNLGVAGAVRRLIAESETDIVGLLDADDALHPECVRHVLNAYEESCRGFVYTNFLWCDINLTPLRMGFCRPIPPGKTAMECGCVSHFKTFRKSQYVKTPGIDESLPHAIDADLIYKLEEVTQPYFVNEMLYYYRTGRADSLSTGLNSWLAKQQDTLAKDNARARRARVALVVSRKENT